MPLNRRDFLATTAATAVTAAAAAQDEGPDEQGRREGGEPVKTPKEHVVGFIGTGIRFHTALGRQACEFARCKKIADVDTAQAGRAWQVMMDVARDKGRPINMTVHEDYHDVLADEEIDVVVVASPDHWHTKHVIEAVRAGKDVYCEKPLTLTIAEGTAIEKAIEETGRIVQVGTQQRTEYDSMFVKAAALQREGRVGDLKTVTCAIGGSREAVELPKVDAPSHLNWEKYLGQCPMVDYREAPVINDVSGWGAGHPFSRAHHYYRWWYEYSGGKLTDWGAHHVDIAMLAMDKLGDDVGLITIDPVMVEHPVEFVDGYPTKDDRFNCATKFRVECQFEDGVRMDVVDDASDKGFDNGVMFEGTGGRFLVNRGKLVGKPVEDLKTNPLPAEPFEIVYGRGKPDSHMAMFFECVDSREQPISDVKGHNAMLNVCHAINIAMRLGRKLTYDPAKRDFVGDKQASEFVSRTPRDGYEYA